MKIKVKILVILNLLCLFQEVLKAQTPTLSFTTLVSLYDNDINTLRFSPSEICLGDDIIFSWTINNHDSAFIDMGDGTIYSFNNLTNSLTHQYLAQGLFTITLSAKNIFGTVTLTTINLTVEPTPLPLFNFSVIDSCIATVQFNDMSSANGGTPLNSWTWNFDNGATASVQNPPNQTYDPSINSYSTISLKVTNLTGCVRIFTDSLQIIIDTSLVQTIQTTSNCPCNNITLNATGTASNFTWNLGDGTSGTGNVINHTYNLPEIHYVAVTGTGTNGCAFTRIIQLDVCPNESIYQKSFSNNNWYFQRISGVSFASGNPVLLTNSAMNGAGEGAATVSHPKTGSLLFYLGELSDGINHIYDATHNIMQNGNNIISASSASGSLIIPFPRDTNRYYVFTQVGGTSPLINPKAVRYSVVDMTLNGGLGGVVVGLKNILLTNTQGAEAMSAIAKKENTCNTSSSYWLTVPIGNSLRIYLIDSSGISLSHTPFLFNQQKNPLTAWKTSAFSKSGLKFYYNFVVYDFNPATGDLYNPIKITTSFENSNIPFANLYYGSIFSPNDSLLYLTADSSLYQYDLTSVLPFFNEQIFKIRDVNLNNPGVLWYGIDGNLYFPIANKLFLGRVNNPNVFGIGAGIDTTAVPLGVLPANSSKRSLQNLVSLVPFADDTLSISFNPIINCLNVTFSNTTNVTVDNCSFEFNNTKWEWNFGDGSPVDTTRNPSHTFPLAGNYTVQLIVNRPFICKSDTIVQNVVTNCPLPIELLTFDATPENNSRVRLNWTTVTEINNDFFTLERSIDAINFEQFKTRQGAGNSNTILHYVDYDSHPYRGTSYYRLKQTDFNGDFSYSDIRVVFLDDLEIINLYPNPAQGQLTLSIGSSSDDVLTLRVVDVLGRTIIAEQYNIQKGLSTINISTNHLASGTYIVKVINKKETFVSKEFIKTI